MKSTPVKGTRDYLPQEMAVRDYLQNVIADTYQMPVFPALQHQL